LEIFTYSIHGLIEGCRDINVEAIGKHENPPERLGEFVFQLRLRIPGDVLRAVIRKQETANISHVVRESDHKFMKRPYLPVDSPFEHFIQRTHFKCSLAESRVVGPESGILAPSVSSCESWDLGASAPDSANHLAMTIDRHVCPLPLNFIHDRVCPCDWPVRPVRYV
jgi:hypothetical protein